ncbi:TIGR03086 family metal-binding protein [Micromonospora sp. WMMD882]|uniref:TIGR03086 family metal-binding protein n=1 Tax=Micromonospora sp. WMMD882 TaxID=3015151 RepID=UPI00248B792E|nr:TIGR03086 family metal-binding protein [Micromonospora sp. WMMD882]WBB78016.1 TIGR03086 family metal-binding protein [Micromonospora sp. WMMD882]
MTTKTSELLTAAAPRAVAVVRGVTDDQLDLPTPCAEYTVRDLLNHFFEVVINFQALAAKQAAEWAEKPDFLADGWRDRFATEVDRVIRAWSAPSALEGVSPAMGMPQEVVGGMLLLDVTVHGWDLAEATGQPYEPDPVVVAALLDLTTALAPKAREAGVFDAETPVDPDAEPWPRLLALTGRTPA